MRTERQDTPNILTDSLEDHQPSTLCTCSQNDIAVINLDYCQFTTASSHQVLSTTTVDKQHPSGGGKNSSGDEVVFPPASEVELECSDLSKCVKNSPLGLRQKCSG